MKRHLFKSVLAIALTLSTVFSLASCGGGGGETSGSQPSVSGQGANEDRVMKVAVTSCPLDFNPYSSKAGSVYNIYGKTQVYDTLFTHDAEGNIVPSIVESYELSPDNLVITMKLHQGVKFSNGDEFTSEDAKFSIETCKATKSIAVYFSEIESIDTPDPYTLVFHLSTPNAALFENLTVYGQMISKQAYEELGDKFGMTAESVIGTGPYTITEFTPEQSVTYVANENYFKGAPNIKKVEVKTVVNDESAIIALQTGEFDYFMRSVPAISVDTIKADPNLELVNIASRKVYYMCFNCENGPFSDPNMRKAVSLAINREDLNIMITEGLGTIVYYPGYPTNIGNPDINAQVAYQQNIEEAKRLVKEAGYEGATITASMENDTILQQFATALQSQLSAIGLNLSVDMMEYTAFMEDVFTNGNYEMTASFNTAKTGDMDYVWTNWMDSSKVGSGNTARYVSPEMDRLIQAARQEMDPKAREEAYKACIALYLEDMPLIPVTYEYSSRVYNKNTLSIDTGLVEQDNFFYFSWAN